MEKENTPARNQDNISEQILRYEPRERNTIGRPHCDRWMKSGHDFTTPTHEVDMNIRNKVLTYI